MSTDPLRDAFLTALFAKADAAGLGIADGPTFEAFPGYESAAADYMAEVLGVLEDGDQR